MEIKTADMNRVIKFRVWDGEEMSKPFDVGSITKDDSESGVIKQTITVWQSKYFYLNDEGVILMQYTGMKDKNGKEIYEGDCLGHKCNVVEYLNGSFCINGDRPLAWLCSQQEIVGNLYEQ